jgi:hypothetical protein
MTTTNIASFTRSMTRATALDALADRAKALRNRADALLQLEADLKARSKALDRREADLVADEDRLREHERGLAVAGQEMSAREATLTHEVVRERFSSTLATLNELETPSLTDDGPSAMAAAIIRAGQVRRGEISNVPPLPKGIAGQIVLAGMKRRGEIFEQQKPRTEHERVAAMIIQAGRRRRGEIP